MKNQYFGDINDHHKYGLLRILGAGNQALTTVCWMLTPNDDGFEGDLTGYLTDPEQWSHFDPDLFLALRRIVLERKERNTCG